MRVVIAGAGLIGLSAAYTLMRAGAHVTLLERAVVGSGASRGNAGEVCPDQSTPVAKAALILSALTQIYRKDSALHVSTGTLPGYLPFLVRVAQNSLPRRYAANQAALASIQAAATHSFMRLADELGTPVSHAGYLSVYRTQEEAEAGRAATTARLASSPFEHDLSQVLDHDGLRAIEPSLLPTGFGFLDEGSLFTDPSRFVDALHQALREGGVDIHEGVTVTGVEERSETTSVRTNWGDFEADAAIIAAGVGSADIAASTGFRLPLKAGKGYSFAIELPHPTSHVFKFESAHVAALPLGANTLRIAGTMEFDSDRDRFNHRRIAQIVAAVSPYLPRASLEQRHDEWVGSRPLTPDGLPVIDRVPGLRNTFLATGHNMQGLMFAPFTAELLRDLVLNSRPLRHRNFAAQRRF